jgi:hypothetical protein
MPCWLNRLKVTGQSRMTQLPGGVAGISCSLLIILLVLQSGAGADASCRFSDDTLLSTRPSTLHPPCTRIEHLVYPANVTRYWPLQPAMHSGEQPLQPTTTTKTGTGGAIHNTCVPCCTAHDLLAYVVRMVQGLTCPVPCRQLQVAASLLPVGAAGHDVDKQGVRRGHPVALHRLPDRPLLRTQLHIDATRSRPLVRASFGYKWACMHPSLEL